MSVPMESWDITPTCRFNRGNDGAWDEAVAQLRQVYDAQVQRFGPTATLTLSITRAKATAIPQYVYDAVQSYALPLPGPTPDERPATDERCTERHRRYGRCELTVGHDGDHVTDRNASFDLDPDPGYSWAAAAPDERPKDGER